MCARLDGRPLGGVLAARSSPQASPSQRPPPEDRGKMRPSLRVSSHAFKGCSPVCLQVGAAVSEPGVWFRCAGG